MNGAKAKKSFRDLFLGFRDLFLGSKISFWATWFYYHSLYRIIFTLNDSCKG